MIPDKLHISFGDAHLYKNHIEQAEELLGRNLGLFNLPTLDIDKKYESIDDFTVKSFEMEGYQFFPSINAPISV